MTKRIVHRLDMLKSAKLLAYVSEHYTAFKMTDAQFAAKATEDLGFPVLESQVEARRKMLEIKSTSNRPSPKNTTALFDLVVQLELRVAALEKQARLPGV